jgi:hypothetical protein
MTHNHTLLYLLRLLQTWRVRSPYLHTPRTGWPDPFRLTSEVEDKLRPTVSRPGLGVGFPCGAHDQIYFHCLTICRFPDVQRPLWREDRCVIYSYSCFWALREQSLSGPSPAQLWPYFTVSFEPPPTWRTRSLYSFPPEQGGPVISPALGSFSSPLTTRILTRHHTGHGWPGGVAVGVLLAANRQSTSSSGYWDSLWDPWPDFILLFFLRLIIPLFFFRRRILWRENGSVVYSAISH